MEQETLYKVPFEEIIRLNREDAEAIDQIQRDTIEHRQALKELNRKAAQVRARRQDRDLNGVQAQAFDLTKIKSVGGTLKDRRENDRKVLQEQVKAILAGRGGLVSNSELAALLGLNVHGLAGAIGDCPGIEKVHDGREKNEQTYWRAVK